MSGRLQYETTLVHEYLGKSKVIRARTQDELQLKVWQQERAWEEQEKKKRQAEAKRAERERRKREADAIKAERERKKAQVEGKKEKAGEETAAAQEEIDACQRILSDGLTGRPGLDWPSLSMTPQEPQFVFGEASPSRPTREPEPRWEPPGGAPSLEVAQRSVGVPGERPFLEKLLGGLRRAREQKLAEAGALHQKHLARHEEQVRQARDKYEKACRDHAKRAHEASERHKAAKEAYQTRLHEAEARHAEHVAQIQAEANQHNDTLSGLRERLSEGEVEATEWYVATLLERSEYPSAIEAEPEVSYEPHAETVVVSYRLPDPDEIPNIKELRYVASRDETTVVELKPKEKDTLYEEIIHQVALRTIHEVFAAPDTPHVGSVVFNGWVNGVDSKTGQEFTSCIISCMAAREQFEELNLELVAPKDCLRGLGALDAGPLAHLAPVNPILDLDRGDSRLVESREVLADLSASDNLATMDWEDFEHLVRELFEQEFSGDGAEVHVTQASRDQGVDAIAFDPDPIRGGKFVIQAKRYNIVVPVAAVRDLYGTMINEGAARGILVTTSHYGRDAHEFAKDKPITLIDGPNLVHMLQRHGREVHIELQERSTGG